MIQSFLQNTSLQPTNGDTFQTLSDNLAERFKELGGKLELQTRVKKITFQGKKATGVIIGNESISAGIDCCNSIFRLVRRPESGSAL